MQIFVSVWTPYEGENNKIHAIKIAKNDQGWREGVKDSWIPPPPQFNRIFGYHFPETVNKQRCTWNKDETLHHPQNVPYTTNIS